MNPRTPVARLDERQVASRNRGGNWSFLLLLVLVGLDGFINDRLGHWASGLVQGLTLFFASTLFFSCYAVITGAHWASRDSGRRILGLFVVVTLLDLLLLGWHAAGSQGLEIWHGGSAGRDFLLLVETLFFVGMVVVMSLRLRTERRSDLAEED